MKTYKNLYPAISGYGNIYESWRRARRGKRYKAEAARFEMNLDNELLALYNELQSETWQPGPYRHFTVHEPKRRKISAAPFRDRVVHHALVRVLEPIYERKFIFDSYANRKGKGTHRALDRCTHYMKRFPYVLQCDIEQYFPAIDHKILKASLEKVVACEPTLRLINTIIDSGRGILDEMYTLRWFAGDGLFIHERGRGLPVGNLTSQFWANVYLNDLDQFVKHTLRCKGYIRYVDDFLLFGECKQVLRSWRARIITFLSSLRLTLHEGRAQVRPVTRGVSFLGFRVLPTHRLLKRRKGVHYQRRLHALLVDYKRGEVSWGTVRESIASWRGHVSHGDTWGLQKALLTDVLA